MVPRLLSAILTLVCSISISAAPSLLRNPRPLRVEGNPFLMLKGNFGGDAAEDLLFIVNEPAPTTIQVLINVPGGPFAAPLLTPITDPVGAAAAGDMDHDGKLDIVIARGFSELVVYRGNGDGTFVRGQSVAAQSNFSQLVIADFNADGHPDVAIGSRYSGDLSVHFGDGTGALSQAFHSSDSYFETEDLIPAQLNGDNFTDLVVMGDWSATVVFGTGDGRFRKGPVIGSGMGAAVGDFNGDGKTDVVARSDSTGWFRVNLQGDGDTFTGGQTVRLPVGSSTVVRVSDIDQDAKPDVVIADYLGTISVLRGKGDGTFLDPEHWFTDTVTSFHTGDFNRDGIVDLVLKSNGVFFIAGTGGGAFDIYRSYAPLLGIAEKREIASAAAADMNGDGKPDLVLVAAADADPSIPYELVVLLGDGAGNWTPPFITRLYDYGAKVAVGDVNHDGKQDVVVADGVYLGRGDGTFDEPIFFNTQAVQRPFLADIDADTHLDLIIPQNGSSDIYRGAGTGSFAFFSSVPLAVAGVADFNRDGSPDLAGFNSGVQVAINNGTGAFAISTLDAGVVRSTRTVADFNGDGFADILADPYAGMLVMPGRGDGTFSAGLMVRTPDPYGSGATADLDQDGALDFAVGARIFLGDGAGRFRAMAEVASGWTSENAVADFDLDGKSDLVIVNTVAGTFALVRTNRGPDVTRAPAMSLVGDVPAPEYAQRVKHTATVTDVDIPVTGCVLFARDGVPLALNWLYTSSTEWTASFGMGAHTFSATYSGDTWHVPVTRVIEYNVVRGKTTIGAYPQNTKCAAEVFVNIFLYHNTDSPLPGATGDIHFREGVTPVAARKAGSGYYLSGLGVGTHTIVAEYDGDTNYEPSSFTFQQAITPSTVATMQASSGVFAGESGNVASLRYFLFTSGTTVTWSITNGTIDSGQGTSRILYTAGPSGEVEIRVTFSTSGAPCDVTITTAVPVIVRQPGASMLFTLTPCRVVDTRGNAPVGSGEARVFTIGGVCNVAPRAKSVAINVTVVAPAGPGWLAFYPSDIAWPGTSTMNYRTGKTRANHAIVPLSADGRITVLNSGPPANILIDVMGYFY